MEHNDALTLLRNQHDFPGPFVIRLVVRPEAAAAVVSAIGAAAVPDGRVEEVVERPSRNGTYLAVRIHLYMPDAERVLAIYGVINELEGIVTAL